MATSDLIAKSARQAAKIAFCGFLLEAMQYLRPDGGSRSLTTQVTVKERPDGRGYVTTIEMVETGSNYKDVVYKCDLESY